MKKIIYSTILAVIICCGCSKDEDLDQEVITIPSEL